MKQTTIFNSRLASVDFDNLEFGKVFTDSMLVSDYIDGKWTEMKMKPLEHFAMHPATSVLHYGQAIFEGLKAYKNENDKINIFRLKDNVTRLNRSAIRMAMPTIDEQKLVEKIVNFVSQQKDWVPNRSQGSLYIRPFMISTDTTLRAVPSQSYRFMLIACPVGFYYDRPLSILLEKSYRRAATGGVGYAKAAGNYAAAFYPSLLAKDKGYDQILWTDVTDGFTLEELGSANFFFVKNHVIYTPKLHDSILKGITRDTIICLAKSAGISVVEAKIAAYELRDGLVKGEIDCVFATGTAAAITWVNNVSIDGESYDIASDEYMPIQSLKTKLDEVKFLDDRSHDAWNEVV